MRGLLIFLLIFISLRGKTQINYTGIYTGNINGDFNQIEIQQTGTRVSGKYIETGNTYDLQGKVTSGQLSGELTISGTTLPLATFTAVKNEAGLHIDMLLLGVTKVSADFIQANNAQVKTGPINPSVNGSAKDQTVAPPKDQFTRDPAVVGHWLKEEVITSGIGDQGESLVTAYFLNFRSDGTFIQEKSSGSGGSNWSMVDQKTPDVSGHWFTKDQIMYVRPMGQKDYVRLNRYLFHEGALVFKTEEGKYLIWNRDRR